LVACTQKRGFALRKPPFYPLNYGDGKKGKSKKEEGKIQRSDCGSANPNLGHRKLSRAREPPTDPRARPPDFSQKNIVHLGFASGAIPTMEGMRI